jgi:hypothetical protein
MIDNQTTKEPFGRELILHHYTYLLSAISILSSRHFILFNNSPLGVDSGLNCFISTRPRNVGQEIRSREARIDFIWTGPVEENGSKLNLPYPVNTLIYQGAWRSLVPFGSFLHLRLFNIYAKDDVWKNVWSVNNRWPLLFSRKRIHDFRKSIDKACNKRPLISVGDVNA